ncbi:MAG: DNA repair protein RecO [Dysgonamonadaceae bacterium]|jgi:DNA repair protein RecO (recombination protein O)|nr:DNA repair protein RecO [Dysgonamonadaceae bacterium]
MQHKTRGIVLHHSPYNDTYAITLIYTEEFGRVSYLTARSKSRKTKTPKSLFHALAVLDLEVEHRNLRDIQRIKEAKAHIPLVSLRNNPVKSAVGIFLAELICKVVREVHPNKTLFDFLLQSVRILELTDTSCANFHLVFMITLSRFLGFYPDVSGYAEGMFFDMQNGIFVENKPLHPHFLNPSESRFFYNLLRMKYENMDVFRLTGAERKAVITAILEYYRLHLSHFPEIKSLVVLHEIFCS